MVIAGAFAAGVAGSTVVGMRSAASPPVTTLSAQIDSVERSTKASAPPSDSTTSPIRIGDSTVAPTPSDSASPSARLARAVASLARLNAADIERLADSMTDAEMAAALRLAPVARATELLALLSPERARTISRLMLTQAKGSAQ